MTLYCKDCKHFRRDKVWWFFMIVPPLWPFYKWVVHNPSIEFGKCLKFPDIDSLLGHKKDFSFASTARRFDHMCGKQGKHWEAKTN